MRNSSVKIFVFVLSVVLVFAVLPARPSFAAQSGVCGEHLTWYQDENGKLTISGYGDMYDSDSSWTRWSSYIYEVEIKENVTSIGAFAFSGCQKITKVSIPNSVKSIGKYAFDWCQNLSEITIPGSVTSMGEWMFYGCINLKTVNIQNGVKSIDARAFKGAGSIYDNLNISIPNSVTTISEEALAVASIRDIVIPESVTYIGDKAFAETSVSEIIIPSSVTHMGDNVFEKCNSLKSVILDKNACGPNTLSGVEADKIHYYFDVTYTNDGHGTISGKSKTYGTDTLELTITPEKNYVLREVTLTDKNKTVKLTRDSNGKYIVPDADTSATINASFTPKDKCGDNLTWTWNGNDTLTITGSGKMYDWEIADDVPWQKYRTVIKKIVLSDSITSIGDYAFYSCTGLTSVTLPDAITVIGNSAFSECSALTSITVSKNVSSIGNYAFNNCKKLASFSIPEKLNQINEGAFRNCRSFKSLSIPESVISIGADAFYWCNNLTSINIPEGVISIGKSAFYYCDSLESVIIPDSVEFIGPDAFKSCLRLTSIKIPYKATVGSGAFAKCSKLKSVVINKAKSGSSLFEGSNNVVFHYYYDVTYASDGNGTISGKNLSYGTDVMEFLVTPNAGYEIDTVSLNYSNKSVVLTANNGLYTYTMPDSDSTVTVNATFKRIMYSISVSDTVNGTADVSQKTAGVGDVIEVIIAPDKGYELDSITVNGSPIEGLSFTMGVGNTTVNVTFKKIEYSINISKTTNGTAKADKEKAFSGDKITITITPDKCYELDTIKVDGISIDGTEFTMPEKNITVDVLFKAKPHNLEAVSGKSPTCTETGYEPYFKCKECGKLFSDSEGKNEIAAPIEINKLDHSWDDGVVTKEPSCEENGVKTVHCTHEGCTETKTETIAALGHKIKAVLANEPTKTEPGNTAYYECERCHKLFKDAKGTQEISLADTVIPAIGHDLEKVPSKSATCTEAGHIEYYRCKDDGCEKLFKDKYAREEIGIEDTVVPAKGHSLKEVAAVEAKCTEKGNIRYWKCSVCGKLFSDSEGKTEIEAKDTVIAALGHDLKKVDAKAATYNEDGNIEHYVCSRCGKKFADPEGKSALTDAEIVIPQKGAPELNDEVTENNYKYVVTNPSTDGTGTLTFVGVLDTSITSVSIPATVEIKGNIYKVTRIATTAFKNNKSVTSVYIGANVNVIDAYAFQGCTYLVKISGGPRLKTIGTKAFANCPRLSTFVITSPYLNKIGSYAFYGDKKLKTIYIKSTTKLTKSGVKKSLKGSKIKTVKVKKSKIKKYKKYFKKSNSGRSVKVKK